MDRMSTTTATVASPNLYGECLKIRDTHTRKKLFDLFPERAQSNCARMNARAKHRVIGMRPALHELIIVYYSALAVSMASRIQIRINSINVVVHFSRGYECSVNEELIRGLLCESVSDLSNQLNCE